MNEDLQAAGRRVSVARGVCVTVGVGAVIVGVTSLAWVGDRTGELTLRQLRSLLSLGWYPGRRWSSVWSEAYYDGPWPWICLAGCAALAVPACVVSVAGGVWRLSCGVAALVSAGLAAMSVLGAGRGVSIAGSGVWVTTGGYLLIAVAMVVRAHPDGTRSAMGPPAAGAMHREGGSGGET